jgi:hypothetical protein
VSWLGLSRCRSRSRIALRNWPTILPVYSHIVVVLEENKDCDEIIGQNDVAPYMDNLVAEAASLGKTYGEERAAATNCTPKKRISSC